LIYPQNLNPIKIPLAMGPGPGQALRPGQQILTPNTRRRTMAVSALGRQSVPSGPQRSPSGIQTQKIIEQKAKEQIELKKANNQATRAKEQYDAKSVEEKQKIKFDTELTYIAENIQIAYEFNVFEARLNNKRYLNVSVQQFNSFPVEEKMYLLLSLLDQAKDLIYGNKNILDTDIDKLIYCNQVFISINNAIAKKYILENIPSDKRLVDDFRDFLNLDLLKVIIWDNSGFSKNKNKEPEMEVISEEEDVWESDNEEDDDITGMKRRKMAGGARRPAQEENLTLQQTQRLLTEFTNELARVNANEVFNKLSRQINMPSAVISKLTPILTELDKYQQYKTIDILKTTIEDVIIKDKSYKNKDEASKINALNVAYSDVLKKYINDYTTKLADMIAEQEAARVEAEARAAERAAIQASREEQRKPGPKHLSIRNDFMETIIKMVLVNCGIYPFNGDIAVSDLDMPMNPNYINMANDNNDFVKQLGILIAKSPFSYPNRWRRVQGVPDDVLFEHFTEGLQLDGPPNAQGIRQIYPSPRSTLSYIVNNAALIGHHGLDGNYFCPISSILDGQSTCSYNSKNPNTASNGQRGLERGNMDFKIQNNQNPNLYYNGKSSQTLNVQGEYRYEINLGFPSRTFNLSKTMALGGDDLTAQKAIKHTLEQMIGYYENQQKFQLDPRIGFFDNLYRQFFNNDPNFTTNMYQILFKGSGDLFQEINAVCKNGGYEEQPIYQPGSGIVEFKNTGDTLRAFYANDRPSACRAFKFLRDGDPAEINQNAFGGYVGKDDESYLYLRKGNASQYKAINGGKANKTKKRQQKSKTKKQVKVKRTNQHTKARRSHFK